MIDRGVRHLAFVQKSTPVALLCGLHFSTITDMAWSADGTHLMIASRDGYCTVVQFEEAELGVPFDRSTLASTDAAASEWFESLEEVQNRKDLLPAKRHIRPQKLASDEKRPNLGRQCPSGVQSPARARRRITPIVVAEDAEVESQTAPPKETDEKIAEMMSSRQTPSSSFFSELKRLAGKDEAKTDSPNKGTTSLTDLFAMSAQHAKDRFGL